MAETNPEKKMFFNSKTILALGIVLLVVVVVVFSFLNRDETGLQEGTVVIKAGGATLGSFTLADLRQLPEVEKKMNIHSSQGNTEHEFTCVPLLAVLNSIDPELTQRYEKILTKGVDNYTSGFNMSEVLQPDNIYIAYADYGKPLKTKTGGDGSMRVIICNDDYGQRFTMWLVSLELQ
jgi:DMSO/TMAO reductase YedYZ molybdopterin-dependent catalytic subunit